MNMEKDIFEWDVKQHTTNQPMKTASDAMSLDETRHVVFGYISLNGDGSVQKNIDRGQQGVMNVVLFHSLLNNNQHIKRVCIQQNKTLKY